MSVLAACLLAVALSDLAGGQMRQAGARWPWLPSLVGVAALALIGVIADLWQGWSVLLLMVGALTLIGWQISAATAFSRNAHHWSPLVVLGAGVTVLVLFAGHAPPVAGALARWLIWVDLPGLSSTAPARILLIAALMTMQISTANVIVRLVLRHVGALKPSGPQASDSLRGGRLLGPLERLVIVGLGLAGQVTAASLVIAAKGLIRWPELQHARSVSDHPNFTQKRQTIGIDEVTEYFLVGSFVSWVVALAAVAVAALT